MSQRESPLLDRERIAEALGLLGDRLVRRGVVADIYVIGGAAMALAYDARRATRDIDAVFQPHGMMWVEGLGRLLRTSNYEFELATNAPIRALP